MMSDYDELEEDLEDEGGSVSGVADDDGDWDEDAPALSFSDEDDDM
jgi:hypothetical protein